MNRAARRSKQHPLLPLLTPYFSKDKVVEKRSKTRSSRKGKLVNGKGTPYKKTCN